MAIQYKEVTQEDEDELIQNCKNNKDCKNNFETVKCEILEDVEDEDEEDDEIITWTWSEIGERKYIFKGCYLVNDFPRKKASILPFGPVCDDTFSLHCLRSHHILPQLGLGEQWTAGNRKWWNPHEARRLLDETTSGGGGAQAPWEAGPAQAQLRFERLSWVHTETDWAVERIRIRQRFGKN